MKRSFQLELASDQREGAVARRVARAALIGDGADETEVSDVELVTSELFANAVTASTHHASVSIDIMLNESSVLISVTNQGDAFELRSARAGIDAVGGRGLEIARALGDTHVSHDHGRTTVTVEIVLARVTSEPAA